MEKAKHERRDADPDHRRIETATARCRERARRDIHAGFVPD